MAGEADDRSLRSGTPRFVLSVPLFAVVLLALYVGLEWLSFLHEHDGLPVTPWNPGLGVMFAMIILRGHYYGIVFFAGVLLAELLVLRTDLAWPIVLAIGAIVAASYTGVAAIAPRFLRLSAQQFHTRDLLVLIAEGLSGAVISSVLLCMLLLSVNRFDLSDIARTAAPLILGDLIGIVVVTPLVLRGFVHRDRLRALSPAVVAEFAAITAAILVGLALIMLPVVHQGHNLFYLLFLPVVFAAVRHAIDGACVVLAIVQLGLVGFLHLHGFDLTRFTDMQVLMFVLTLTGLLVGALVSERRVADEAARAAAERLNEMQAEAARTARLNLVSGMAAALAHEVNQPMTAARALARSVQTLLQAPNGD